MAWCRGLVSLSTGSRLVSIGHALVTNNTASALKPCVCKGLGSLVHCLLISGFWVQVPGGARKPGFFSREPGFFT